MTPGPSRVDWLRGAVIAHRGAHAMAGGAPGGAGAPVENSLPAFAAAMARGLAIECDVQRAADDVAVVFHDATLDRLTDAEGPVSARTSAELGQIPLVIVEALRPGARDATPPPEPTAPAQPGASVAGDGTTAPVLADTIPTLAQLLGLIAGRVPLLIEIKVPAGQPHIPLCRAIARDLAGYTGPHAVMSFDPRVLVWFARHHAETTRGLILSDTPHRRFQSLRRALAMRLAQPHYLALDIRDLPSRFAAAQRAKGLPIATWTVRDAPALARARLHADAPIAEGPALAEAAAMAHRTA